MSEYIIDTTKIEQLYKATGRTARCTHVAGCPVSERIVRCRDCKHYAKTETMWEENEWCVRCSEDDSVFEVDADGFCAWGEVKNG